MYPGFLWIRLQPYCLARISNIAHVRRWLPCQKRESYCRPSAPHEQDGFAHNQPNWPCNCYFSGCSQRFGIGMEKKRELQSFHLISNRQGVPLWTQVMHTTYFKPCGKRQTSFSVYVTVATPGKQSDHGGIADCRLTILSFSLLSLVNRGS